jgi:hypothetical protein
MQIMNWWDVHADPKALKALQTTFRASAPTSAQSPLIRAAQEVLSFPVFYYRRHSLSLRLGNAPSDAFYTKKTLYVGPEG